MDGIKNVKAEMYEEPCTDADGNHGRMNTFGRLTILPDCIGMYFKRVWASNVGGRVSVDVKLWAEGEFGTTLEHFSATRLLQLRNYEPRQANEATSGTPGAITCLTGHTRSSIMNVG